MGLQIVMRRLEQLDRLIAACNRDIEEAGFQSLQRLGDAMMLADFRNMVEHRRDAILRHDALIRVAVSASSSAGAETEALLRREEAEQKAKAEAEQKAKAEAERKGNEEAPAKKKRLKAFPKTQVKRPRVRGDDNEEDNNEDTHEDSQVAW